MGAPKPLLDLIKATLKKPPSVRTAVKFGATTFILLLPAFVAEKFYEKYYSYTIAETEVNKLLQSKDQEILPEKW